MEVHEKVQADGKAREGGSHNTGAREKYLQEALEIASIYDSLFLAQARNLLITSDKRQGDVAREIGVEIVYI
ncbi:hypothetical protein PNA2_1039 [Pyrococcus sp. NA2]|nr:hypothetical protein PNA2_1039 [Pyrococcus sp. NA2]